ncbi:MAG: MaoC family dehydratase [Candidatus Binatia bacterium]
MRKIIPKPFSEIDIGDEIGPVATTPTREVVQRYATVARITDRRFIDPEVAKEKGFANPIVPGPLSATFLAQMVTDHFPGWRLQNFQVSFRTPVRHGDTLNCWGNVTEKSGNAEDGSALIHCDVIAENQNGDRVIVGTAILGARGQRS